MCSYRFFTITLIAVMPVLAFARLGETGAECNARYGKVDQSSRRFGTVYKTKNCMVTVFFGKDGKANRVTYLWRQKTEDAEIFRDLVEKNFGAGAYADRNAGVATPETIQHFDSAMNTYPVYPKDGQVELAKPETRRPIGYFSVVIQNEIWNTTEYTCLSKQAYEDLKPIQERRKAVEKDTSGL